MTAWIRGRPAEPREAVGAGGRLLAAARMPLIAGLVADVDAIRSAYKLALTLGAALDPAASPSLYADLGPLAGAGAMTTTPSELIGRADLVLVVGAAARSPLVDELVGASPSRGRAADAPRTIASLGSEAPGGAVDARSASSDLAAAIANLRALVNGRSVRPPVEEDLRGLAERLPQALFGVALYDPGELGDLAIEMLQGLVKDLNKATRFSSLALADDLQGRTALQVGVWTTGDAPRVGLARGYPEHDPWRFDAERLVGSGEADAVLWLASLSAPRPTWLRNMPGVALLGEATGDEAEIVIKVAVPGESAPGTVWDTRRGTLVHRRGARPNGAATATAILADLERVIETERGVPC